MSEQKEQWLEELVRLAEKDDGKKTEKQARILEAAIEIFAEKGFAAASTSEIALRAGVAEGTIFRHYKTKKDLLLSIAGPIAVKIAAPFLLRDFASKVLDLPYQHADELFRAIARDRIAFARKNMKLIRILVHEIPFQPELLEQVKGLFRSIVLARMETIIQHLQEQGQIIQAPPWRILRTAISMFIGMFITQILLVPEQALDDEEEIEHTIDLLLHGISASPRV
ncbi:TetR/AcrR family transcriptional regulator [Paenibacillus sp. HB172176]|uniref:TetR/AcrR family transcriptional regulator n=1 Tax=Paenibacillus sp. HB172176 TaxID=2493690 RepID=UPI001439DF9B|nr:TetR/AcrR family transcriptional regulator [Paenibacillus sp. HB172176]